MDPSIPSGQVLQRVDPAQALAEAHLPDGGMAEVFGSGLPTRAQTENLFRSLGRQGFYLGQRCRDAETVDTTDLGTPSSEQQLNDAAHEAAARLRDKLDEDTTGGILCIDQLDSPERDVRAVVDHVLATSDNGRKTRSPSDARRAHNVLVGTLELIDRHGCANSTGARCSTDTGRARSTDEGTAVEWCDPCRARDALTRVERLQPEQRYAHGQGYGPREGTHLVAALGRHLPADGSMGVTTSEQNLFMTLRGARDFIAATVGVPPADANAMARARSFLVEGRDTTWTDVVEAAAQEHIERKRLEGVIDRRGFNGLARVLPEGYVSKAGETVRVTGTLDGTSGRWVEGPRLIEPDSCICAGCPRHSHHDEPREVVPEQDLSPELYWDRGYVESFIRGELREAETSVVRRHVAALLGDVNQLSLALNVAKGQLADVSKEKP